MEIKDSENTKRNCKGSEENLRVDSQLDSPSTSRRNTEHPEHESHNMNDLRILEYNSADEIRQAMKEIMAGKTPQNHYEGEDCALQKDKRSLLTSPNKSNQNVSNTSKENSPRENVSKAPQTRRKRPGRPTKSGPSKKLRRFNITDMFLGKLSNVVPFKNKKGKYEYESDSDSTLYVYW